MPGAGWPAKTCAAIHPASVALDRESRQFAAWPQLAQTHATSETPYASIPKADLATQISSAERVFRPRRDSGDRYESDTRRVNCGARLCGPARAGHSPALCCSSPSSSFASAQSRPSGIYPNPPSQCPKWLRHRAGAHARRSPRTNVPPGTYHRQSRCPDLNPLRGRVHSPCPKRP